MEDTENADPRVGSEVQGRYRILSRIADGSMGVVYRAERLQLGRHVAIKFLHASYAADSQFIQRFERETRVMSKLSHPHCVSVIDFGVEGAPYVVMEYVSGRTLRGLLEDGPISVERALHITRQILGALAHAHSQDIVHRDIKPANIMLTEATGTGDHVRILDFGLATLRGAVSSDLSQSQIVVGTPNYMSPEQSMANKVDGRSDLYSTGVVLFELLTGQKPYMADDTFELLTLHRTAPIPKLAEAAPDADFPRGLQGVIDRVLAKAPEDRYASAIEMAQALDEATRPRAGAGTSDASVIAYAPTESFAVHRDRHGGLGFFGTLLVLALLGGAGYAGWRYWQEREAEGQGAARDPIAAAVPMEQAAAPATPTDVAPAPAAAVMTFDAASVAPDAGVAVPALDGGAALAATALDAGAADEQADEPPLPAEEQDEPVEPVAEAEAEADVAEPTTAEAATVAAPPEPEPEPEPEPATTAPARAPVTARRPNPVDTVPEAVALIRAGKREQAIRALLAIKKKAPRSAYVPYLLGNLYFSKRWWTVGMDYYRSAIAKNGLYRGKRILNTNVIRALGDRRTAGKASRLFTGSIRRAALPYLRRAARSDRNPKVRRAAAYLVRRLSRRR
ncbi:MAG TPA: serine/threonine-protein kinase [Kofleriaceae bacterium]|nr:serine/threonine-protein kinase [Kofleriaceae bacterium]